MNELKEFKNIENMIYEIRGKQVMLDSDLAILYDCINGTKTINQAVKRNIERFPKDFYFQLTEKEYLNLKSQIGTSSLNEHGGIRKMPFVFTEQGVAMLATVIKTKIANTISINIMRAFVKMRHCLSNNLLTNMVLKHDNEIKIIQETLNGFNKDNEIFLKGQYFDAYSKVLDILKTAKNNIIIIDSYADYNILNLIKKINTKTTIITNNKKYITDEDINIYKKEYSNLNVLYNNSFHDRFIIIDNKHVYLIGTSINNIGSKISTILLLQNNSMINILLNEVKKIINEYQSK